MTRIFIAFFIFLNILTIKAQTFIAQVSEKDGEWGYINNKGEKISVPEFDRCYPFSAEGLAIIENTRKNRYYIVNTKGALIPTELEKFEVLSVMSYGLKGYNSGLLAIGVKDKWGYLDVNGKIAINLQFEKVSEFNAGYAIGRIEKKIFVIDSTGKFKQLTDPNIKTVKKFSEGMGILEYEEDYVTKYGFLNTAGEIAIKPVYSKVGDFSGGLAWVRKDDKIGFINKSGILVIPVQFDVVSNFDPVSGLAKVKKNEEWFYINRDGVAQKLTTGSETINDFEDGMCLGKKDGKFGYYDPKGNWTIEPKYQGGREFKNGYAAVKDGELWGFMDKSGNWVIKPVYQAAKDMQFVYKKPVKN